LVAGEVQGDAQLVAVDVVVDRVAVPGALARLTVGIAPERSRDGLGLLRGRVELPAGGEALDRLDVDDLSAPIGQQGAGVRAGPHITGVQYADTFKRQHE